MPRRTWIVRNGFHWLLESRPRGWKNWPSCFQDLDTQRWLRITFHRKLIHDDHSAVERYLGALKKGDERVLWGDPRTSSCLAHVWVLA